MTPTLTTLYIDGQPTPLWDAGPVETVNGERRPVLVFLHGWGLAPPAYWHLLVTLAQSHRVIAPFIPGLCWNRPVRTYRSHHDLAATVLAVTDRLELGRFHLAGQSTGGGIAAVMAAERPNSIASLTLIDASGLPDKASKWPMWARTRELVSEAAREGVTGPGLGMARSFLWNLVRCRGHMIRVSSIPLTEDLTSTFTRIEAPSLILWGERDLLFPVAAAFEMQRLIPDAMLHVVTGVHHSWEINGHARAARLIAAHTSRHAAIVGLSQFQA
jgi:pimeloyl-ACP methyl ester carboxylesterase